MSLRSHGRFTKRNEIIKPREWVDIEPNFDPTQDTDSTHRDSMDQMIPKQPLIIIIWIHQEMMAWMSRESIRFLYSLMEDFGS
jgi:hypothetical protein